MPWSGPDEFCDFPTLGWEVIEWIEEYLRVPSGERYGQPLELTDEQATLLVHFYKLTPSGEHARRVFRRGAVRRSKGWGKSPLLAAICLAEFAGPVLFDGWDAYGRPVGRPQPTPWVQIAATSEEQTANTYSAVYEMLRESDLADDHGIDAGLTRVTFRRRPGKIEPISSSAGAREGQPITFAVLDETHLWFRSNGGRRLAATLRRNLAKMHGTSFETTNAFRPGEGSVAEDTYRAHEDGQAGLLYSSREGPDVTDELVRLRRREGGDEDRAKVLKSVRIAYGSSTWVDPERVLAELLDPATEVHDGRRYYLNQLVGDDEDVVDVATWRAIANEQATLNDRDVVALGFDGSDTDDSTALVAVRWPDWQVFVLDVWARPVAMDTDAGAAVAWQVPRVDVHNAVDNAFARYRVTRMYADPPRWATDLDKWRNAYGKKRVIDYPTYSDRRAAAMFDRFVTMVAAGDELRHDGDVRLEAALGAARRQRTRSGWRVEKRVATGKVDVLVAAMLAVQALGDAAAAGETEFDDDPDLWAMTL